MTGGANIGSIPVRFWHIMVCLHVYWWAWCYFAFNSPGRVTHMRVSNLAIIGSDNGLSPGRRQAIIWTNAAILLIHTGGTNLIQISMLIHTFSFKEMHLKMSSAEWWQFCLGLNVSKWMFTFSLHQGCLNFHVFAVVGRINQQFEKS